ncbi:MAG: malate synthase G [Pseudomonadota bacterium]
MEHRVEREGLQVADGLARFLETQALPGTGIEQDAFWQGFARLLTGFHEENQSLLHIRDEMQSQVDAWHLDQKGAPIDGQAYQSFLRDIGYICPEGADFEIETANIDREIADVAGPQLVVPITNARFALNAANARWGSLYDAFYGTDALGSLPPKGPYDAVRGADVVAKAKAFLDQAVPLATGTWQTATREDIAQSRQTLALADPGQFKGTLGTSMHFEHHGLGIIVEFDPETDIGAADPLGVSDVWLESALSSIMDCEDSVACVDAEDKVLAYSNWLGLMRGDLEEAVTKAGETFTRRLNADQSWTAADGQSTYAMRARALMLVRNVGHLMQNPAILLPDGQEAFEGLMDAMITVLIACHDLQKPQNDTMKNSPAGSVYVVKPKMHGPDEVAFADRVFSAVEDALGLPAYTVKLGIMDEERRTSINLKACIRAAKHRVAFINTGFLDRTGDEIHTSMEAGAFAAKGAIKDRDWIAAYEALNVDIGLECGLMGRAQIGKGMWAMPDRMADMLSAKIGHPKAGANCAWVPSPTAATLHAMHYHEVDVAAVQAELKSAGRRAAREAILDIPLDRDRGWSAAEITREVENNAQGILGYVVRWIDQGVGCSKVPDLNGVGLMEDRATCRISAQHIANWLHHGVVSREEVEAIFRRMAAVVDAQNAGDPAYTPMAPGYNGIAFAAAQDLVFKGREQPSGYTEPVLHARRLEWKAA